jgi:membrane protein DedA with SNARE-associated domain
VHELGDFWPFFTAFAALVAAGCGFPIPEEIPTIGAGLWVGSNPDFGPLRWLILPVCFVGVLISDVMLYHIGRWSGYGLLERPWVKRLMPPDKWERIQTNFDRYGLKVLLLIRWVPAIRSPMFISAGIMRLPLIRFVVADSIAAVFGHSLLFFLAFWFGDQFRDLVVRAEQRVDQLKPLLILLLLAGLAGFLLYHFLRRPVSTADPEELPLIGDKVASKIEHLENPAPSPLTEDAKKQGMDIISNGSRPRSEATQRDAIP